MATSLQMSFERTKFVVLCSAYQTPDLARRPLNVLIWTACELSPQGVAIGENLVDRQFNSLADCPLNRVGNRLTGDDPTYMPA